LARWELTRLKLNGISFKRYQLLQKTLVLEKIERRKTHPRTPEITAKSRKTLDVPPGKVL
jgi:hypothetical protein